MRVYNLRLLILITLAVTSGTVWDYVRNGSNTGVVFRVVTESLIPFHHISVLFVRKMPVAALDLFLTVLEIILAGVSWNIWMGLKSGIIIPLVAARVFRLATLRASPERFWRQKFVFLGGCSQPNPPYTPWRILLNRSLARPLVRGEFVGIIILRALILSGIFLAIPIFAVYSVIFIPLQAHIRADTFAAQLGEPWESYYHPGRNATIAISQFLGTVNVTAFGRFDDAILCTSVAADGEYHIATCLESWYYIVNITVSLSFVSQNTPPLIYIIPGQGNLSDLVAFTDSIPVLPGSQLLALMTWTSRQVVSSSSSLLWASFNPWRNVLHMELYALLNANNLQDTTPLSSKVVIVQRGDPSLPTKWVQESATTPLDGISTVGGLWTFVEGLFVLLFGANVIYFAFGRRPLTALGIMHLFQRRSLIKRWHEDFPALYDEGGLPGDTSAGIVAFIRERLVDLDPVEEQGGKNVATKDPEVQADPQQSEIQANCAPYSPRTWEDDDLLNPVLNESSTTLSGPNPCREYLIQAGYRLDDVPFTD